MSRAKEPAYDGCNMIGQPMPQTGTVPYHLKGFLCPYDDGDGKNIVYAYETPLPLAPPTHTLHHLTWQLGGVWNRSSKRTSSISKNKKILRLCYIVIPIPLFVVFKFVYYYLLFFKSVYHYLLFVNPCTTTCFFKSVYYYLLCCTICCFKLNCNIEERDQYEFNKCVLR